jgi:hypothetical protein
MAKRKDNKGPASRKMAKIVVAQKKDENGSYSFKQKIVPLDDVEDELKAVRE